MLRTRSKWKTSRGGRSKLSDVYAFATFLKGILSMQAGSCFGISAASCKAGINLMSQIGWIGLPLGLICSAMLSSLGFMLQTLGLKDGNTVAVCTCAAVASMGTGLTSTYCCRHSNLQHCRLVLSPLKSHTIWILGASILQWQTAKSASFWAVLDYWYDLLMNSRLK